MARILGCWIACFALSAGLGRAGEGPSRLVALVAGRPVTALELSKWLRVRDIDPAKTTRQDWELALAAAIDRAVLAEAAKLEKIEVSDAEAARVIAARRRGEDADAYVRHVRQLELAPQQELEWMRESLVIERLLARKLGAKLFVAPAAVSEWYEKNKDLLATPEVRVARVITVEVKPGADRAAARKKIDELRERVVVGADFAELAKAHSDGPWAAKGGLMEPMERGTTGSVFAGLVFATKKVGEVTDVVETESGFHILKLEEIRPAAVPSFKEAQPRVRQLLEDKLRAKHVPELAMKLRQRTTIRVFRGHVPGPKKE